RWVVRRLPATTFEVIDHVSPRVEPMVVGRVRHMTKKDIHALYEYNRWCNARIFDATARVTDAEFVGPGAFPHGGLRGTLVHALFAEWTWRMRWLGTPPQHGYRFNLGEFPTAAALRARWETEEAALMEFVARLPDRQLTSEITYTSTEGGRHT